MNVKKCVRALLCLYLTLIIAMDAVKAQTLKVGDTLPPELWSMPLQVVNHPTGKETLSLSEYKDKLIILDFWATWCSPCIAMLPKQDSLQRQFKDQIQILPITYQTGEEVSTFMEKYEKRKGVKNSLPKVVGDNVLNKVFPHMSIPHYVWISHEGVIKAITSQKEVTGVHILNYLENNVSPSVKAEPKRIRYNSREPLLVKDTLDHYALAPQYQSALTPFIPGLTPGYQRQSAETGYTRITMKNQTISQLAAQAYGEARVYFGKNRIRAEVSDISKLVPQGDILDWMTENSFCYEIIVPQDDALKIFKFMQSDLQRYFGKYNVSIEERDTRCYVLSVTDSSALPLNRSGEQPHYSAELFSLKMINCHPTVLADRLNFIHQQNSPYPLVNQTGIEHGIDLEIEASLSDMDSINAALVKYGLAFEEKVIPLKLLIISDDFLGNP